jgi:hypothetical protein
VNRRNLWVVELLEYGVWHTTVGVRLSRQDGREEIAEWRLHNPTTKFRLVKYAPASIGRSMK